jgi:hypothetical protein
MKWRNITYHSGTSIHTDGGQWLDLIGARPSALNRLVAAGEPLVWCNHGQYRLITKQVLAEYKRLHDDHKLAMSRAKLDIGPCKAAIYWDDCIAIPEDIATILFDC